MNQERRCLPKVGCFQARWRGRVTGFVLVATALVGGTTGQVSAQAPATVAGVAAPAAGHGGPVVQFARTEHDFGRVKCGTTLNFDFAFTNAGDAPLEIRSVQSSCGCTVAGNWTKSVQPGQTGTIPIQFTTAQLSGPVRKSVTVTCNAPDKARSILNIVGTVWREIDLNPEVAFFTPKAGSMTVAPKVIRIVNNMEEPLELAPPECADKAFTAELKTLRKGREFELLVSAMPPFRPDVVQVPITLKTSSKSVPVLTVKALVMVQLPITVMPQQLVLGPAPLAASSNQVVTVRNLDGTAVSVSEPTVNVPGVAATIRELQPGRVFAITLEFPARFVAPAGSAELSVKTSHPLCPIVKVAITHQPPVAQQSPVTDSPLPPAGQVARAGDQAEGVPRPTPQPPQGPGGKGIETNPAVVYFTPPVGGKVPESQRVHITNRADERLAVDPPECSSKSFAAELKTLAEGREYEVLVSAKPPFSIGTTQGTITLKTSSKDDPVIRIKSLIIAQLPLTATPSQLVLGPAPLVAGTRLRVAIHNSGGDPVTFSEPTVNVPGVVAGMEVLQPGRACQVTLDFSPGFEVKPGVSAELSVKTSHPQYPVVRVPILRGSQPVPPPPAG